MKNFIITYDLEKKENYTKFKEDVYSLFKVNPPEIPLPNTTILINDYIFENGANSSAILLLLKNKFSSKYSITKLFIGEYVDNCYMKENRNDKDTFTLSNTYLQ